MSTSSQWSDLSTRLSSAIVMIAIGFGGIWFAGIFFNILVALSCALMVWELMCMSGQSKNLSYAISGLSGLFCFCIPQLSNPFIGLILLGILAISFFAIRKDRLILTGYILFILLGGAGILLMRENMGFGWMMWLIVLVVVTDVMGYFAGRMLGGPKFWPAISPKKTWSGTVFGWIGAILVGYLFSINSGLTLPLILLSLVLSFGSQMGDILESAIKRRMNVKDSSNLIPGHGGFLDRFDGLIGASVLLLIIGIISGFPPGLIS